MNTVILKYANRSIKNAENIKYTLMNDTHIDIARDTYITCNCTVFLLNYYIQLKKQKNDNTIKYNLLEDAFMKVNSVEDNIDFIIKNIDDTISSSSIYVNEIKKYAVAVINYATIIINSNEYKNTRKRKRIMNI